MDERELEEAVQRWVEDLLNDHETVLDDDTFGQDDE